MIVLPMPVTDQGIQGLLGRGTGRGQGEIDPETAGMFEAALLALLGSPVFTNVEGDSGEAGAGVPDGGGEGEAAPAVEVNVPASALAAAAAVVAGRPALAALLPAQALEALAAAAPAAASHAAPLLAPTVAAPGGAGAAPADGEEAMAPPVPTPVADGAGAPTAHDPASALPVEGLDQQAAPVSETAPTPEGEGPDAPVLRPAAADDAADTSRGAPTDEPRPAPRASERALEALRAAAPAAQQHAAPLRSVPGDAAAPDSAEGATTNVEGAAPAPAPRTSEVQPTTRTVEVRPGSDARPAEPHQQVVSVLRPLRQGPDGTYRLTLQLHPQELGRVRLDVQVRDGQLVVHLAADDDAARELLRDALPALQADLEGSGFDSASVDVGRWDARDREAPDAEAGSAASVDEIDGAGARTVPAADPAPAGAVDVRI